MSRPLYLTIVALSAVFLSFAPRAYGECNREIQEWTGRCQESASLTLELAFCPEGAVLFDVQWPSSTPVRIEVSGEPERGFDAVANYGVAVVGEFADWNVVGPEIRGPYEAVLQCVKRDPTLPIPVGEIQTSNDLTGGHDRGETEDQPGIEIDFGLVPWRLLLALALGAVVFVLQARAHSRRRRYQLTGSLVALTVGTFVAGIFLFPPHFFHQNGQGPLWILNAMCRHADHGQGHQEVFRWVTRLSGTAPDTAIFSTQAILGALWPMWVWVTLRSLGVRPALAWVCAALVAFDPVSGRIIHSESYYATALTLFFPAVAVLAVGSRTPSAWRGQFPAAVICAGLLISQAARVHPVGWVPSAFIPLVVLVGDGKLGGRVLRTALAGLGIALVVGLTTGTALLDVLYGDLGQQWGGNPRLDLGKYVFNPVSYTWLAILVVLSKRRVRAGLNGALFVGIVALALGTNVAIGVNDVLEVTMPRLFLPVAIAIFAAALREIDLGRWKHRVVTVGVLIACLFGIHHQWDLRVVRFTDALEQRFLIDIRDQVSAEDEVVFVGGGAMRVVTLPFYGACSSRMAVAESCGSDGCFPGTPEFYYRSSFCSTDEGAALCESIEARWNLELLERVTLPARVSVNYLPPYLADEVEVGLYRIVGYR